MKKITEPCQDILLSPQHHKVYEEGERTDKTSLKYWTEKFYWHLFEKNWSCLSKLLPLQK